MGMKGEQLYVRMHDYVLAVVAGAIKGVNTSNDLLKVDYYLYDELKKSKL
jgi:hypothetical protein